jgi:glucose/arabinose dehydrogenase
MTCLWLSRPNFAFRQAGGSAAEFQAGLEYAVQNGWLEIGENNTGEGRAMRLERIALACVLLAAVAVTALAQTSDAARQSGVPTGEAAFGDWRADAPFVRRMISVDDLPKPFATRSVNKPVRVIARPSGILPTVPPGFQVELFAAGFKDPRALVVAPNGDLFVAESDQVASACCASSPGRRQAARQYCV